MKTTDPLIDLSSLSHVGQGLKRAESVIATARGELFVSDHDCAVRAVDTVPARPLGMPEGFLPNGIALTPAREFLVANLGTTCGGGVWRLDRQGQMRPLLMEVEGVPLTSTNFVSIDAQGRTWVSMSTRQVPRELAFKAQVADGFIAVSDARGARIVADGIEFTNECRVDPGGRWVYVNETYGRKLSRFAILGEGAGWKLGPREVVHQFTDGDFPDGLAFDAEGGVWVACVVSNRVLRIGPDGRVQVVLDDSDAQQVAAAEAAYARGSLSRGDIDSGGSRSLRNVSSVAFGGPDLRTVYLGNLAGDRLASFRSPIAGAVPPHWNY
ncbi:SMP-30/gluconolactonase/LRE family protein [Ramlibacter sp. MAHUQ-53]|uniref:SMP-30/gluconolactonase/LRE family protein n=1 Tax=unclassified Ramlibacter TaxID=2617605 RepID=UPI00362FEF44